jgi:hypothetical protein
LADVLELHPALEGLIADGPSYRRIRLASGALAVLFALLTGLFSAYVLALLIFALIWPGPGGLYAGPHDFLILPTRGAPPGYVAFRGLSLAHQLTYCGMHLVRSAPALMIFWSLRRLFGLYAKGVVFARENAALIKQIGLLLAADAAAPFICHLFLTASHWEIDHNWLHFASLQELVLGGVVVVIALVMEAGREIEEDRGQFI